MRPSPVQACGLSLAAFTWSFGAWLGRDFGQLDDQKYVAVLGH